VTTLAIMKARIESELARGTTLTSQIASAINDAIAAYRDERFFFTDSRTITFSTVSGQEFYSSTDAAAIATIRRFDYIGVYIGDQFNRLEYHTPAEMEWLSTGLTASGAPFDYTFYQRQIRLYPTPDAVYTVRVGASVSVAAPASDSETDNPWMVEAERLIRSRAKAEIALHVMRDTELAQTMTAALEEAYDQLKGETAMLTKAEGSRIRAMEF
jgi:hypothetical protein